MTLFDKLMQATMTRFRLARAQRIRALHPGIEDMRVLDLGGSLHFWRTVEGELHPREVVILNVAHDRTSLNAEKTGADRVVLYDGKIIPFADGEFDLLICNSVIEHVPVDQRAGLVSELRRVAKRWIVQTPAHEFPIEPHFVAPFIHWLPRPVGRLLSNITPFAWMTNHPERTVDVFDEIHLLSRSDITALFPGSAILVERFAGLPKSYLVHN